jgi:preprotein translocase subunit SecG
MRRWQKTILVILAILYVIPFAVIIWHPESQKLGNQIDNWLINNNMDNLSVGNVAYYYAIILGALLLIILLLVLFWPHAKDDVVLQKDKDGELRLDNHGITAFINRSLSGSSLSNAHVMVKNRAHSVRLKVEAETPYRKAEIKRLDDTKQKLDEDLKHLLRDTNISTIKTNIIIKQARQNKKNTRVI